MEGDRYRFDFTDDKQSVISVLQDSKKASWPMEAIQDSPYCNDQDQDQEGVEAN